MATRRDVRLTDSDVDRLRGDVAAGRRPRVRMSGTQFPAGTLGTVLRVGDPSSDGEDFVTVRLKVGGVTDELQFSPRELSVAGTGRDRTPRAPSAAPGEEPVRSSARRAEGAPASGAAAALPAPALARKPVANAAKRTPPDTARGRKSSDAPPLTKPASAVQRRSASIPVVTLAITSSGSSWSVTAQRGARTVVKNSPVQPGVVAAISALLGQPAVDEAVAAINGAALAEAEGRADRLRAELAEVEAVLIGHRRP